MNYSSFIQLCKKHEAALLACLPSTITGRINLFHISAFSSQLFNEYGVDLPKTMKNSVVKRQAEFLAGRVLAKELLLQNGSFKNNVEIGNAREPIWPKGFIGSISHSDDVALVIISEKSNCKLIGCDIEPLVPVDVIEEIKLTVLLKEELHFLYADNACKQETFTLIYSAKESLYKALYPSVGFFFDFQAAKVVKINSQEKTISLSLTTTLNDSYKEHSVFTLRFSRVEQHVITVLYME